MSEIPPPEPPPKKGPLISRRRLLGGTAVVAAAEVARRAVPKFVHEVTQPVSIPPQETWRPPQTSEQQPAEALQPIQDLITARRTIQLSAHEKRTAQENFRDAVKPFMFGSGITYSEALQNQDTNPITPNFTLRLSQDGSSDLKRAFTVESFVGEDEQAKWKSVIESYQQKPDSKSMYPLIDFLSWRFDDTTGSFAIVTNDTEGLGTDLITAREKYIVAKGLDPQNLGGLTVDGAKEITKEIYRALIDGLNPELATALSLAVRVTADEKKLEVENIRDLSKDKIAVYVEQATAGQRKAVDIVKVIDNYDIVVFDKFSWDAGGQTGQLPGGYANDNPQLGGKPFFGVLNTLGVQSEFIPSTMDIYFHEVGGHMLAGNIPVRDAAGRVWDRRSGGSIPVSSERDLSDFDIHYNGLLPRTYLGRTLNEAMAEFFGAGEMESYVTEGEVLPSAVLDTVFFSAILNSFDSTVNFGSTSDIDFAFVEHAFRNPNGSSELDSVKTMFRNYFYTERGTARQDFQPSDDQSVTARKKLAAMFDARFGKGAFSRMTLALAKTEYFDAQLGEGLDGHARESSISGRLMRSMIEAIGLDNKWINEKLLENVEFPLAITREQTGNFHLPWINESRVAENRREGKKGTKVMGKDTAWFDSILTGVLEAKDVTETQEMLDDWNAKVKQPRHQS